MRLVNDVKMGETNIPQLASRVKMRLFNKQKELSDDFDWTEYHNHYRHEINLLEKKYTLLPSTKDFTFDGEKIVKTNPNRLPLHCNHNLLYETVLKLNPANLLEIGCGGGDHLNAISTFNSNIELNGVDRSEHQLNFLRARHPKLKANLSTCDISSATVANNAFDLVYTQAVLMHISEKNNRFHQAIRNVFKASRKHVVLMENWSQHDFISEINKIKNEEGSSWKGASINFKNLSEDENVKILIVTKEK